MSRLAALIALAREAQSVPALLPLMRTEKSSTPPLLSEVRQFDHLCAALLGREGEAEAKAEFYRLALGAQLRLTRCLRLLELLVIRSSVFSQVEDFGMWRLVDAIGDHQHVFEQSDYAVLFDGLVVEAGRRVDHLMRKEPFDADAGCRTWLHIMRFLALSAEMNGDALQPMMNALVARCQAAGTSPPLQLAFLPSLLFTPCSARRTLTPTERTALIALTTPRSTES